MKIFLIASVTAMISAGIYGTVDLARDISHDTYIRYEEDIAEEKPSAASEKTLSNVLRKARKEVKEADKTKEKKDAPANNEIRMKYFSRSSPNMYDRAFFEELAKADSLNNKKDSAVATKTTSAEITLAENRTAKKDSLIAEEKKERKFSATLFSRGKPRSFKKENIVVQTDSVKTE